METTIENPKEEQLLKTAVQTICREMVEKERRGLLPPGVVRSWMEVAEELAKNPTNNDTILFRWNKEIGGELCLGGIRVVFSSPNNYLIEKDASGVGWNRLMVSVEVGYGGNYTSSPDHALGQARLIREIAELAQELKNLLNHTHYYAPVDF